MIAPPGWECQPEEPPTSTVICAIATSVPTCNGMVPFDTSVPRAKGTFVSPDGGVASTVPAYAATPMRARRSAKTHFDFISPPFQRWRRGGFATPPLATGSPLSLVLVGVLVKLVE